MNKVSCMGLITEQAVKQTEIALRGISTNDIMVTYGMKGNPYNLCSIFHCLFPYLHTVTSQCQMRRVRIHALYCTVEHNQSKFQKGFPFGIRTLFHQVHLSESQRISSVHGLWWRPRSFQGFQGFRIIFTWKHETTNNFFRLSVHY